MDVIRVFLISMLCHSLMMAVLLYLAEKIKLLLLGRGDCTTRNANGVEQDM